MENSEARRRDLLPKWIKFFCWFFMIFSLIAIVSFIVGLFGINFKLSFLGLTSHNTISLMGLCILGILIFKGIVAYGLWFEKNWAVNMSLLDGVISVILCVFSLFNLSNENVSIISFRMELIAIIPYLVKMYNIRNYW